MCILCTNELIIRACKRSIREDNALQRVSMCPETDLMLDKSNVFFLVFFFFSSIPQTRLVVLILNQSDHFYSTSFFPFPIPIHPLPLSLSHHFAQSKSRMKRSCPPNRCFSEARFKPRALSNFECIIGPWRPGSA